MSKYKISIEKAIEKLSKTDKEFSLLFEHGSLQIEMYQPHEVDKQSPHEQDEAYIVVSGSGKFMVKNEITDFKTGDFLFVPAQTEHRFIDFTDDFMTWVIFYGQKNGEKGEIKNHTITSPNAP